MTVLASTLPIIIGVIVLIVALVGYEVTERRERNGNKRTDRQEIYRDEVNLEEAQQVEAGFWKSYPLSIGGRQRRLEWKVEARADLPGVDLAQSKSVRVNVG
jgi:hypothetical protein